ncbi:MULTISPECIES: hypothetical protein [unclassified Streptomyces]|uniref:hypothetical protein n=1 Tax=unclassified Streptomyces TaxID=2593676 RepID=UPI00362732B0
MTVSQSSFLNPESIPVRLAGVGYENGTAVVWIDHRSADTYHRDWSPTGISLWGYLEGREVGPRTEIADADDLYDLDVQYAVTRVRLEIAAAQGRGQLLAARHRIEAHGEPADLMPEDPGLRAALVRRVQDGTASAHDLEVKEQVDALGSKIDEARRRYTTVQWRYLAHLYRCGMPAQDIAAWTDMTADMVTRRIGSVPTTGAAALLGTEAKTWSGYVSRGQAPAPDDHIGREPVWHLSTVLDHMDNRPGRPGRPARHT